ncbi:AP-2 complex subunit sigma isoform X3 [Arachis hypogaea]|uniref:AP-2 complex subunit sigma isoform X3 n=1 Tax=Arachis hypogaea TaxID=3818 RepID=UPI003B227A95
MIRFILLQNRQGKTRLAKYYVPLEDSEKHKVEYEVHRLVVNRDPKYTNFVEFRTHKVYLILDEFILAGELQETSKKAIIERMGELEKLE